MPYARRIGEIDQAIGELHAVIHAMRRGKPRPAAIEQALGELARLKAARTRLMMRQRLTTRTDEEATAGARGESNRK